MRHPESGGRGGLCSYVVTMKDFLIFSTATQFLPAYLLFFGCTLLTVFPLYFSPFLAVVGDSLADYVGHSW